MKRSPDERRSWSRAPARSALERAEVQLRRARSGDEEAFRRLVEPYRGALHAHCYRMLRSGPDAEDALQDTLLRAWRGLNGLGATAALASWLYSIASNVCRDQLARRRRGTVPLDLIAGLSDPLLPAADRPREQRPEPLVEAGAEGPGAQYERREEVEHAVVAALELPAQQRTALLLREVLGYSASEVALSLRTSVQAVNSALQRARLNVGERRERGSGENAGSGRRPGGIVAELADAVSAGDAEAIIAAHIDERRSA